MFAAARIDKIKRLLMDNNKIEVTTLVKVLNVSEATVRRDLEKLEQDGFLIRIHGGAILQKQEEVAEPIEIPKKREKDSIAKIASRLVENGDVLFIGEGTTCFQFALELKPKKNLTIVSTNVSIATSLAACPNIILILTGGNILYEEGNIALGGEFTNKFLSNIGVDKVFISVSGLDKNAGLYTSSTDAADVMKCARKMSNEMILLCDYSKFGRRSLVKVGTFEMIDKVVTNENIDDEYKQLFDKMNIPLYTSYNL